MAACASWIGAWAVYCVWMGEFGGFGFAMLLTGLICMSALFVWSQIRRRE